MDSLRPKKEIEYPYRQCMSYEGIQDCHNLDVEELTGKPKPPDDCPKKEIYVQT